MIAAKYNGRRIKRYKFERCLMIGLSSFYTVEEKGWTVLLCVEDQEVILFSRIHF